MDDILIKDLKNACTFTLRAYNTAENSGLNDSKKLLNEVFIKLSQELDFQETLKYNKENAVQNYND